MKKILLLGSGELGREVVIEFIRRGCYVIAADRYENAPAMQLAHENRVLNMNDAASLSALIKEISPDIIVPEIEAIATEVLIEAENDGINVTPSAKTANLTMNRQGIREFAANLGVPVSGYFFAESYEETAEKMKGFSYPVVMKPLQSSSGKGQLTVKSESELEDAWNYAISNSRGDSKKVIVEEFINFDYEITLLTVNAVNGITFVPPIRHRQEKGDYQESVHGFDMTPVVYEKAKDVAAKVVTALAKTATHNSTGYGLFGVELFIRGEDVIFSEVSPRPHDTGMVTLISQQKSEFALHAEAVMGLPVDAPIIRPAASKAVVIKGTGIPYVRNVEKALLTASKTSCTNAVYIFNKPRVEGERRCAVVLTQGENDKDALDKALLVYNGLEFGVI